NGWTLLASIFTTKPFGLGSKSFNGNLASGYSRWALPSSLNGEPGDAPKGTSFAWTPEELVPAPNFAIQARRRTCFLTESEHVAWNLRLSSANRLMGGQR